MSKIIVVGSLNMDLSIATPKVPVIGETMMGNSFMISPGGKGANQAVAASRLGADVSMIGCIGKDIFGKDLLTNLSDNGINIENIKVINDCYTGIAMVVISNGNNFIVVDPGANYRLSAEMIEDMERKISKCDIILIQLEIPLDTVYKVIEIASKYKVKVLLNPAPAVKMEKKVLSKVDIITPNESECEIITGLPVRNIKQAKVAADYLRNFEIPQVIITMGKQGAVYNNGDKIIHKPVKDVKVVDTTAAGDSFSAAVAVALSSGLNIDDAIDFANKVGTLTVMKKGAQLSLPTLDEVKEFFND